MVLPKIQSRTDFEVKVCNKNIQRSLRKEKEGGVQNLALLFRYLYKIFILNRNILLLSETRDPVV